MLECCFSNRFQQKLGNPIVDITTAFLRGKSDNRELAMEAPPELRSLLNMDSSQVCLLQGMLTAELMHHSCFIENFENNLKRLGLVHIPRQLSLFTKEP